MKSDSPGYSRGGGTATSSATTSQPYRPYNNTSRGRGARGGRGAWFNPRNASTPNVQETGGKATPSPNNYQSRTATPRAGGFQQRSNNQQNNQRPQQPADQQRQQGRGGFQQRQQGRGGFQQRPNNQQNAQKARFIQLDDDGEPWEANNPFYQETLDQIDPLMPNDENELDENYEQAEAQADDYYANYDANDEENGPADDGDDAEFEDDENALNTLCPAPLEQLKNDSVITVRGLTMVIPPNKQQMVRGGVRPSDQFELKLFDKLPIRVIRDTGATVNIITTKEIDRLHKSKLIDIRRDLIPVKANLCDYGGHRQELNAMIRTPVSIGPIKNKSIVWFSHKGASKNLLGAPGQQTLWGSCLPEGVVPIKTTNEQATRFVESDRLRLPSMQTGQVRLLQSVSVPPYSSKRVKAIVCHNTVMSESSEFADF
jgi:hypothetical protein